MNNAAYDLLNDTDIARIYREVYGSTRFGESERMFAKEIELLVLERVKSVFEGAQT